MYNWNPRKTKKREKRERERKRKHQEIRAKKSSNLVRHINLKIREAQQTSRQANKQTNPSRQNKNHTWAYHNQNAKKSKIEESLMQPEKNYPLPQ